jgi:ribonuclease HII
VPGTGARKENEMLSHLVFAGVFVGAVAAIYLHRAYVKSEINKAVTAAKTEYATVIVKAHAEIASLISTAKADVTKISVEAAAIVAKAEADIKKIL